MKRKDIRVRDPYILFDNGCYYMYATSPNRNLICYVSYDLENWEEGNTVFELSADSWADRDLWAPEVHLYKGRFYMFLSLLGKNGLRGTQIFVADTPKGPFLPITDRAVTPLGQSCIDGTLYVDSDGTPYIFYSHDWPDNFVKEKDAYVGEICVARLSDDLTAIVGEPWVVYGSDESPISSATPHHLFFNGENTVRYGSDAPFVQKLSDGQLLLTWSPYLNDNYVVLGVISKSGDVKGPWTHLAEPIYDKNGGHAMFFNNAEGKQCMCIHAPEQWPLERACIFEVGEADGSIRIIKEIGF